ncbi:PREDICTED: serine protease 42-like [Ceratosolen solmsi marchali]|uniref:Phenoloxidase-activating factor 2 n=1 Tax=Ceratosolen solmsi marchali TaxID=326594 RepID=A0AAJ6YV68_9HYME|nr:PREDICTED: serine protease 42-like [Ceratosolen solmsi marchali]
MKVVIEVLLLISLCTAYKLKVTDNVSKDSEFIFYESLKSEANIRFKRDTQTDYENSICECMPYYQCNYNGTTNEYGQGIIDIRSGIVDASDNPMSARRKCDHYLDVCCLPPEVSSDYKDKQNQTNQVEPGKPDNNKEDQDSNSDNNNKSNIIDTQCGLRNSNGISFKISGNLNHEANFAEFPWMVAVMLEAKIQENVTKVYQCGGSLINMRVVLTAAHCVFEKLPSELFVRAGEWDTQTASEPLPHQNRAVSIVSVHPKYDKATLLNDFALLILSKPFDAASNVKTTCLPDYNIHFDETKCFASGWGKNEFGESGRFQVILKAVELPTIAHDSCQNALRTTRLGKYFKLHQSFMCAGGASDADTCTGDGGSPLVCPLLDDPTRYVQVGIVAWGIACGQLNIPGVYANVVMGRQWIDSTLASYNIDSTSYSFVADQKSFDPAS